MLRELITILRSSDPLRAMRDNFARMLQITYEMTVANTGNGEETP